MVVEALGPAWLVGLLKAICFLSALSRRLRFLQAFLLLPQPHAGRFTTGVGFGRAPSEFDKTLSSGLLEPSTLS